METVECDRCKSEIKEWNMCSKEHLVISKNLNGLLEREIIALLGCGSLINFKNHLVRTNAQDYNIEMIDRFIENCECKNKSNPDESSTSESQHK